MSSRSQCKFTALDCRRVRSFQTQICLDPVLLHYVNVIVSDNSRFIWCIIAKPLTNTVLPYKSKGNVAFCQVISVTPVIFLMCLF